MPRTANGEFQNVSATSQESFRLLCALQKTLCNLQATAMELRATAVVDLLLSALHASVVRYADARPRDHNSQTRPFNKAYLCGNARSNAGCTERAQRGPMASCQRWCCLRPFQAQLPHALHWAPDQKRRLGSYLTFWSTPSRVLVAPA